MHHEFARVWVDVANDPQTRVAVITGAGKAFSSGGDIEMESRPGEGTSVRLLLPAAPLARSGMAMQPGEAIAAARPPPDSRRPGSAGRSCH